jgi:phospholipase/carboxylesterase
MHTFQIVESGAPRELAQRAIILLHGRGGTAEDILGLGKEFADEGTYLVAPQATNHTWYPYGFMAPEEENEPWLSSAIDVVKRLLNEVSQAIPQHNVYLMGFSQGACLTLEVAGRYAGKYAGVASFTGGMIGRQLLPNRYSGNFQGTPIFIGNSDFDPHVPQVRSEHSAQILESLGAKVHLAIYPGMPHTITREEIARVKEVMF